MSTRPHIETGLPPQDRMPAPVRRGLWGALAVLLVSAALLVALRGEALLLDLQAIGTRVFCW